MLNKKTMHRSKKYDNAPMPFAQFIDTYGIALHAGHNPGHPASHGCVRLPRQVRRQALPGHGSWNARPDRSLMIFRRG